MNKLTAFATSFALLCGSTPFAIAADDGGWVTCKDGAKVHSGASCANRGGEVIPVSTTIPVKAKPIDTTKGLTPNKAAKTTQVVKNRNQQTASTAAPRKAVSTRSSSPTARCNDGAMYFSRERKGACASHGGIDKWFGW